MNLDEHFLRGIFGILLAAQYREGDAENMLPIGVDELAKCVAFAAQYASDQFLFVNRAPPLSSRIDVCVCFDPCIFFEKNRNLMTKGV